MLVIPNIESSPTFDGQACPDATDWAALSAAANGTGVVSGMTVTQHTGSDMLVSIAAGSYMVNYVLHTYAGGTATVGAADLTDRRDIVSINTSGTVTVTKGTDSGTAGWTRTTAALPPVKPAIPASSCLLGEVYVAFNTTVITTAANIIDKTALVTQELLASNNLSDLASASTARTNLGLGTAATQASSAFDAAGTSATETTRAEAAEALLAPLASPALTGSPTAPTKTALTNNTDLATTAYADAAVGVETTRAEAAEALLAPLASPALTGTPTAPTKTALTNNTDIATTAYADAAVAVETSRAETAEALALPKAGGTMSGAIAMGTNAVTGATQVSYVVNAVTVTTNAGTVPVTSKFNNFTNSSAAAMTITFATSGAVDGQVSILRIYDFTGGVAQNLSFVNTENGDAGAPAQSRGSTTIPRTIALVFNSATTKWTIQGWN